MAKRSWAERMACCAVPAVIARSTGRRALLPGDATSMCGTRRSTVLVPDMRRRSLLRCCRSVCLSASRADVKTLGKWFPVSLSEQLWSVDAPTPDAAVSEAAVPALLSADGALPLTTVPLPS
jgi:hypothetical protein